MLSTIDSAGRIVVPKALRDALGFVPGQRLEIRASDGKLEIEPLPTPMRLERRKGALVAVPEEGELPTLTAEEVRATLEGIRR